MNYTVAVEIDLPRARVLELFDNPDNMTKWQPDLVSFEHISGEPGQTGAKSRLSYKMGRRDIEMIETITKRNFPDEFNGTYQTKGIFNIITNRFEIMEENKTKWTAENEFQFSGFMKLMGFFMKGGFPKHTLKMMNQFKEFAEQA